MPFASRLAIVLALSAVLGPWAAAQAQGDPVRGKKLAYTCLGCHGIENYKNVYPSYSVPKLHGQHPEYIELALQGYQSGDRGHGTMHAQAASLSSQDMKDIAAYLAGQPLKPGKPNPERKAPQLVQLCESCHGFDGIGILPEYPTLAGQHEDYLERSLNEYKQGTRKNAVMAGFVTTLKPEEIRAIADYYAKLPGLETEDKRETVLED